MTAIDVLFTLAICQTILLRRSYLFTNNRNNDDIKSHKINDIDPLKVKDLSFVVEEDSRKRAKGTQNQLRITLAVQF